jgi:hypothetical protein
MALMRSDSTTTALTDRRSSTGGVIVLLSPAPRPLRTIDSAHPPPITAPQRCPLTRSRRPHLQSTPAHRKPNDHAVHKSP